MVIALLGESKCPVCGKTLTDRSFVSFCAFESDDEETWRLSDSGKLGTATYFFATPQRKWRGGRLSGYALTDRPRAWASRFAGREPATLAPPQLRR